MRKMPDKMNQLPAVLISAMPAAVRERRHSRKSHAVFNHPENLAVRQVLRFRKSQVRRPRIKAVADHRVAAAIVAMADGAVVREVQPRVTHVFRRLQHRILRYSRARRDCQTMGTASYRRLQLGGSRTGTEPVMKHGGRHRYSEAKYRKADHD